MAKGFEAALKTTRTEEVRGGEGSFNTPERVKGEYTKTLNTGGEGATRPKPTPMGTGFGGVSADEFKKGK